MRNISNDSNPLAAPQRRYADLNIKDPLRQLIEKYLDDPNSNILPYEFQIVSAAYKAKSYLTRLSNYVDSVKEEFRQAAHLPIVFDDYWLGHYALAKRTLEFLGEFEFLFGDNISLYFKRLAKNLLDDSIVFAGKSEMNGFFCTSLKKIKEIYDFLYFLMDIGSRLECSKQMKEEIFLTMVAEKFIRPPMYLWTEN